MVRKTDINDLIMWLKYGEIPSLISSSSFTKSYALMQRGLYIQKNKAKMYKAHLILKDIDYDKAQSLASIYNLSLVDFLSSYFAWLDLEKEFLLYVEDDAEKVSKLLTDKVSYFR